MAESAYVYKASVPVERMPELITVLFKGEGAFAVVRRVDKAEFVPCNPTLPGQWTSGQAFDAASELRWQPGKDARTFSVLLLAETVEPNGYNFEAVSNMALTPCEETHAAFLWGSHRDEMQPDGQSTRYLEARIPRLLSYPIISGEKPPRIVQRQYREEKSGAVRWTRLVCLTPGSVDTKKEPGHASV